MCNLTGTAGDAYRPTSERCHTGDHMSTDPHTFAEHLKSGFSFGIDQAKAAAALRGIADLLDVKVPVGFDASQCTKVGSLLLQSVQTSKVADREDFTFTTVTLTFAERRFS